MSASPQRGWARPLLTAALALVAVNVLLVAVAELFPGPSGPAGSSYATSERGLAAWAQLLADYGHDVQPLRQRPDRTQLDPAATVVVVEPDVLTAGEAAALARFVERGGRLVAAGADDPAWIDRLVPEAPAWTADAPTRWSAAAELAASGGVRQVESAGAGAWSPRAPGEPLVESSSGHALAVAVPSGRGRTVLVADPAPFENRFLQRADNAALALALVGGRDRPVRFVEAFHGYGDARGLGALPRRWRLALLGLGLAVALGMLSAARRIGPPDAEPDAPAPARREFVDAVGLALERTGDPAAALEPARRHLEERLAARAALLRPSDAELERTAGELGLDREAARAVAGRSTDVLALGRALARLSQTERHGHRVGRR